MTDSPTLTLYDISSPHQPRTYAPNPTKSRLALNFKRLPFTTIWTDITDIPKVRKSLNCPATRQLDDGSDFYTLPILVHSKNGEQIVVGESFDIANYLQDTFPESGECLFPPDSTGTGLDYESPFKDTPFIAPLTTNSGHKNQVYAKFNLQVDATLTANTMLVGYYLPFNPSTADAAKAIMIKRAHITSWEDLLSQGEKRKEALQGFEKSLTSLAACYAVHEGIYLEGEKANYADLIVGGWLNMFAICMPEEEWKEVKKWHGGVFGRLHDALQKHYF
ncbi:hypothetical protein DFS34DRAFT_139783 [Phlyctochytrium arcticum]|nr:hypothetical protein DFS34DRAFT_139783 [Phlyctochytrium arcticum]